MRKIVVQVVGRMVQLTDNSWEEIVPESGGAHSCPTYKTPMADQSYLKLNGCEGCN